MDTFFIEIILIRNGFTCLVKVNDVCGFFFFFFFALSSTLVMVEHLREQESSKWKQPLKQCISRVAPSASAKLYAASEGSVWFSAISV